ncbi:unnamed protein product [marine sediment metagenome]|uniref:Response regulatory domain-containing protein n=1 Tax=marine sediment metagenome TaxID=412755 RepID=X0ZA32_9ZZZZ
MESNIKAYRLVNLSKYEEKVKKDGYINFRRGNFIPEKNLSEKKNKKRKNKKKVILIVDDEPLILDLTEKFLKLGNFEIITSSNAIEAIKVIEGRHTDISLILLDDMMPGRSGMDVLRQIRAEDRYNHILVVLFTLKNFDEDIQKAQALGADGYIGKPFSGKKLLKYVQNMLQ